MLSKVILPPKVFKKLRTIQYKYEDYVNYENCVHYKSCCIIYESCVGHKNRAHLKKLLRKIMEIMSGQGPRAYNKDIYWKINK